MSVAMAEPPRRGDSEQAGTPSAGGSAQPAGMLGIVVTLVVIIARCSRRDHTVLTDAQEIAHRFAGPSSFDLLGTDDLVGICSASDRRAPGRLLDRAAGGGSRAVLGLVLGVVAGGSPAADSTLIIVTDADCIPAVVLALP